VCLVNPQIVQKKIRSPTALQRITQQYSFVFVAQQQPLGVFSALARRVVVADATSRPHPAAAQYHPVVPGMQQHEHQHQHQQPPMFSSIKPAVDPRAVKSHSFVPPAPRHNDNMPAPPKVFHAPASGTLGRYQPRGGPAPEPYSQSDRRSVVASSDPPSSRRVVHRHVVRQNSRRISPRRQPTRRVEEDYDIRDTLGSGTTGEVRRAIERRTGIQRAVKIIPVKQTLGGKNSADATAAILAAEANLLQQLDHPYVVKLINVYSSPTAVCLVMELLHGGDLFDRIVHKGRYSEVEARRVMRRLLSAMHYLHEERHIVHRDLKPENILLRSRENDIDIQITDFGLAKAVAGGDGLKTFCGTATYCAPEILQRRNTFMGRGRYNKQADQWSLGVILYILLSGCQPFDGDQWMAPGATPPPSSQVPDGFISFPEEFWADVSELACDLVRQMLVVDPKKRISVRDACNHPWILLDDGDTHRHPLEDPRIPRASHKQAMQADATGVAASNAFGAAVDEPIESPCASLLPPFPPPMSPGGTEIQRQSNSIKHDFQPVKGNNASSTESGPSMATASSRASLNISDSEGVAFKSIALLASDANKELSDDEIHSQFSEKTDSVSSFDTADMPPVEHKTEGVAGGSSNPEVAEKENVAVTREMPRKRRVTTSVSGAKSPKARKSTPARKNGAKPKKAKKSAPPEPATAQTRKQTTLSAWLKQK
jgi:serine/threonine protein kinase